MPLNISDIKFDLLTADPGSPTEGQIWYNTTDGKLKVYRAGAVQIIFDESNQADIDHTQLNNIGALTHSQLDAHVGNTNNPHVTTIANIGSGTLAQLNTKITDATLDDVSGARTPTAHAATHKGDGSDPIAAATTSVDGLLSASDKLKLDDIISGQLTRTVRNETGSPIAKGKLVAVTGWSIAEGLPLVVLADKDDPDARPAIGITETSIANLSNGQVVIAGTLSSIDTSTWGVNDQLVLGNSGDLSRPPPDVDPFTGEVQNIGSVVRVDPTNGSIHFIPDGLNAVTSDQIFALAGTDGTPSKTNPYVTDSDPRVNPPTRYLTVGLANADYTSIKAAVDAAIAGGASATSPWEIKVFPGTYVEDPMTIVAGIALQSTDNRIDTVFVAANNPADDLFTCTGGYITGLNVSGVTDTSKSIFRMATASTLTVLHGISMRGCATGIDVSGGAAVVATNISINIVGVGQAVTVAGISVSGTGSYFGMVGGFFSAPAALLPFYATNPIQTVARVLDGAQAFVVATTSRIANKDTTADTWLADNGSTLTLLSSEISSCYRAARIGSTGSGSTVTIQGCALFGNTINGQSDSTTGTFLVSSAADDIKWSGVAGSVFSGFLQLLNAKRTYLIGDLDYYFASGKSLQLEDWFHDQTSTGVAWPDTNLVTAGTGLSVDVAAGHGYVTRHAPEHDSALVEWDADTVSLTASTTNYIGYDSTTSALAATTSLPGTTTVLLATAITDGTGIRFLHRTRTTAHDLAAKLNDYLLVTRSILLKSGLSVVPGSAATKFQADGGEWYRAIDIITYTGTGTDAVFSYFYGTNGATEVASQTDVDTTNYDNAGTLTAMTAGYYRADTVLLTSDGRISVIYGTAEYTTQIDAETSAPESTPTFIEPSGIRLAKLIVEQGVGIASIIDERPIGEVSGGGGGAVTNHSDLAGLDHDDHIQYLLASGTRPMAGDLNMGGNIITNVSTVDGVDVSAHAVRHNPGGVDSLTLAAPVATLVGASPSQGTAASYTRSDHQHGIGAAAPVAVGTANAEGTASTVARSDHVHAGLTRGAGDFNSFAGLPGSVAAGDVLLLEDADQSFGKAKVPFSGLEGAVSHLNILNIGTNTHAQIDSHIASTSNPHSVTSTQVGLGNVTNDAQLKRAAGDFSTFLNKAVPVGTDVFLIEDSADSGNKKYATLASLPSSVPYSNEVTSTTLTTTTGTTDSLISGMTLTPPAGTYMVWFTGSIWNTTANNQTIYVSIYAGGTKVASSERTVSMKSANDRAGVACVARVTVNGAQTIEAQWRVLGGTANNQNRSLAIIQVS